MPRIFFRDDCATVTATELIIGPRVYPLAGILSARGLRLTGLTCWPFARFALAITTPEGEMQIVLRHRRAFVVFQLSKAIEAALREMNGRLMPAA